MSMKNGVFIISISWSCLTFFVGCSDHDLVAVNDKIWLKNKLGIEQAEQWVYQRSDSLDLLYRLEDVFGEGAIDTVYLELSTGKLIAFDLVLDSSFPGIATVVYSDEGQVVDIDFFGILDSSLKVSFAPTTKFTFFSDGVAGYVYDEFEGNLYKTDVRGSYIRVLPGDLARRMLLP